jgi:hypothetical protein
MEGLFASDVFKNRWDAPLVPVAKDGTDNARLILAGEIAQPRVDYGPLVGSHLFEQHAHAENTEAAAGMQVDDFALQFARADAMADSETKLRPNGNRYERTDITTSRAQFSKL